MSELDSKLMLSPDIPESYRKGWSLARKNFGNEVFFYAPTLKHYQTKEFEQSSKNYFTSVSITGRRCALKCDHCRALILGSMKAATTPEALFETAQTLYEQGARGLLISGGSSSEGVVPLLDFCDIIAKVKERFGFKVIVHTGITNKKLARGLAGAGVDAAMIDVVGADETIHSVYHLNGVSTSAYEASLDNLCNAGVCVAPHVVLGLHYGKIQGELKALKIISNFKVSSLVLVGLLPQPGTPMAGVAPPSPEKMGEIFLAARELLPLTPILLGCERPAGNHKSQTDQLALKAGINGIAYPAEGIMGLAHRMGLKPRKSEMCCALAFQDLAVNVTPAKL